MLLSVFLAAQEGKVFTVTAGSKVEECIPAVERYHFPEFTAGKVIFRNGTNAKAKLNCDYLVREMQYIQGKDTLSIANEKDILQIFAAGDTFIIFKGFLELIYNRKVQVGVREYLNLVDMQKKDPYGIIGSGSVTKSYTSINNDGKNYKLVLDQDILFQKVSVYYIATSSSGFVPFTKKKVMQLFPKKKDIIEIYLESNHVDFNSREDLLRLAKFLSDL